jgi:hypothetical protein
MADDYGNALTGLDSPASYGETVDIGGGDHDFTKTTRALYVGVAGNVKVDFASGGTAITLTALANGWHPIRITKVYQTGTTATSMVGVR